MLRSLLIAAGVMLCVAAALGAAGYLLIDVQSYKPRIAQVIRQATGREVSIAGPIGLSIGLAPILILSEVGVAGPPGHEQDAVLTLERAEIQTDFVSLVTGTLAINRLTLVRPRVRLESGAARNSAPGLPAPSADEPSSSGQAAQMDGPPVRGFGRLAFGPVRIENMQVTWADAPGGQSVTWDIPRLDARPEEIGGSMLLTGRLTSNGQKWTLSGELTAPGRLLDRSNTLGWQAHVNAKGEGVSLSLSLDLAHGLSDAEAKMQIELGISKLAAFADMLPNPAPELRDGALTLSLHRGPGRLIEVTALTLHAIGLTVPSLLPGSVVQRVDINAPASDRPVKLDLDIVQDAVPVRIAARLDLLSSLMPQAHAAKPVPLEFSVETDGALITGHGTAREPAAWSGLDVGIFAKSNDLSALSPLLHRAIPPLKQVAVDMQVTGDISAAGTYSVHNLSVVLPQGDVTGDLTMVRGSHPSIRGALKSSQLDLDNFLRALGGAGAPASPGRPTAVDAPVSPPAVPAEIKGSPAPPALLLSDRSFDIAPLRAADMDITASIGTLRSNGQSYSGVSAHMLLTAGQLTLDPLAGDGPGGKLLGRMLIDARSDAMPVELTLQAPALPMQLLAPWLGDAGSLGGTMAVDMALTSSGTSRHALASHLDGHIGLASSDMEVDRAMLAVLLAPALRAAHADIVAEGLPVVPLRCFALRADARQGAAAVDPLVIDTGRLALDGKGAVDFGAETLALTVKSLLRAGPGVVVPWRIDGAFRDPVIAVDAPPPLAAAAPGKGGLAALGAAVAAVTGRAVDPCPAALRAVRGQPDAAPAAADKPAPAKPPASRAARPAAGKAATP